MLKQRTRISISIYIYTHTSMRIHIYIYIYTDTYTCTDTDACMEPYARTRTHADMDEMVIAILADSFLWSGYNHSAFWALPRKKVLLRKLLCGFTFFFVRSRLSSSAIVQNLSELWSSGGWACTSAEAKPAAICSAAGCRAPPRPQLKPFSKWTKPMKKGPVLSFSCPLAFR